MSDPLVSARMHRLGYVRELSRALVRSLADHDVSQAELAAGTGRSVSHLQRWCDPERPEVPTVADVPLMPHAVALDLLRWMAGHHDQLVAPAPDARTIDDDLHHMTATMREFSEAMAACSDAMADGNLATGGDRALRELDEAIECLVSTRERFARAVETRSGNVRRMVPRGCKG